MYCSGLSYVISCLMQTSWQLLHYILSADRDTGVPHDATLTYDNVNTQESGH